MHEEATKLHNLLADGLNTGAFLVQVQNKLNMIFTIVYIIITSNMRYHV